MNSKQDQASEVILSHPKVLGSAEDVAMSYLRGEIDEDKFRDGMAQYGATPGFFGKKDQTGRIDEGFTVKIPDDFFDEPAVSPSTEDQVKLVNTEAEAREKATEASDKVLEQDKTAATLAEKQNAAAREAYDQEAVDKERAKVYSENNKTDSKSDSKSDPKPSSTPASKQ